MKLYQPACDSQEDGYGQVGGHENVESPLRNHPCYEGDNQLIGIVTLRDVLLPLYPNYGDYIHNNVYSRNFVEMEEGYIEALGGKVEEIMSRNPVTVAPHDPVLEAASYMGLKKFRRIPVVDKGTLIRMVSLGDINRGLFFERGMQH